MRTPPHCADGSCSDSLSNRWPRVRDAEDAAAIHRRCRRGGDTVRSLIDCQVAAMALRIGVAVAHRDRDYEAIRTHCGLRTEPLF